MGRQSVTIRNGFITFYLCGRDVFGEWNTGIQQGQKFLIQTKDKTRLNPQEFVQLIDVIYRRKIKTEQDFIDKLYTKYYLAVTGGDI